MVSNQIRPPGFPPVQNPHANSQNNFSRGNNFNQNRGNNFNQGQIYRPPVHQPVVKLIKDLLLRHTLLLPVPEQEDLKGITTRSGVTIQGPKAVNHDTEVTKDTMPPTNNGSTKDVQPPVVQVQSRSQISKPDVESVSAPKVSIPFPSRRNDE
ncbi:hypothetical protein Tco_0249633, partial [Tanacetum coccineum]